MIQANELRIRNWVYYKGERREILSIDGFNGRVVLKNTPQNAYHPLRFLAPIPLTKEVLEACGANIVNHVHGYSFYSFSESKINKFHIGIYEERTTWMSYIIKHCKYLHQLQNAYYTITGEELIYKPA